MSISVPVTVLFVGLFALMQVPLTIMVGFRRAQTGIHFFDGGDQALLRRMRAHGNFTETVPIVLLAMAAAEIAAIPHWALWAGGLAEGERRDDRGREGADAVDPRQRRRIARPAARGDRARRSVQTDSALVVAHPDPDADHVTERCLGE